MGRNDDCDTCNAAHHENDWPCVSFAPFQVGSKNLSDRCWVIFSDTQGHLDPIARCLRTRNSGALSMCVNSTVEGIARHESLADPHGQYFKLEWHVL